MRAYLKKMLSLISAGVITLSALPAVSASAQDVSKMTPKEIAADMGIGWNLGNALDAHASRGMSSETSWGNPKVTKALIDAVKDKGFRTIRVPVTWYNHADSNNNIDKEWMARVRQVVDWCIDEDTYVIIDVHHEEGDWLVPTDANYQRASARLADFWKQIATEFKDYDRHLIFEGMNEPRVIGSRNEWNGGEAETRNNINKLDQVFVDTVRATGGNNKTRLLMVPTYAASSTPAAMNALKVPNDPNMLVSVHCYSPYNFVMNTQGTSVFDSNQLRDMKQVFTDVKNSLLSKGYTVVVGEFGASNKNNTDERVKWAEAFASEAKSLGLPIIVWDNNMETDVMGTGDGYGLINRNTNKWYPTAEPIVNKLIETYDDTIYMNKCAVTLSEREFVYDGSQHRPAVTVTHKGEKLTEGVDYTVKYQGGTEIGDGSVIVSGTGGCKGSVTVGFCVVPADISGYKLGDVNFDGKIDVSDVTLVASHVKGFNTFGSARSKAADVSEDGKVTVADVTMLASYVKGTGTIPDKTIG